VLDFRTGFLLDSEPSAAHLARAVRAMTPDKALSMRQDCQTQARRFDETVFLANMRAIVEQTLNSRPRA
jgi:hypothetical protein